MILLTIVIIVELIICVIIIFPLVLLSNAVWEQKDLLTYKKVGFSIACFIFGLAYCSVWIHAFQLLCKK